jgi:hypothetical protein
MLCPTKLLLQKVANEIDESANDNYSNKDYYLKHYGGLEGWTIFKAPYSKLFLGEYRNGEPVGSAMYIAEESMLQHIHKGFPIKGGPFLRDLFYGIDETHMSTFYREQCSCLKIHHAYSVNSLSVFEQELQRQNVSQEEINYFGFIEGFSSQLNCLVTIENVQKEYTENYKDFENINTAKAGAYYPLKYIINVNEDPDWLKLQNDLHKSSVGTMLNGAINFDDLENYGEIIDGPWYKVISCMALVNWAEANKTPLNSDDEISQAEEQLKTKFSLRAVINIDKKVVREIQALPTKGTDARCLIPFMINHLKDCSEYDNYIDNWLAGNYIGQAFRDWDIHYAFFVANFGFLHLNKSGYLRTRFELSVSNVFDKLTSEFHKVVTTAISRLPENEQKPMRSPVELDMRFLNPLNDLKGRSSFIRYITSCTASFHENGNQRFSEEELGVIIRMMDDDMASNISELHQLFLNKEIDEKELKIFAASYCDMCSKLTKEEFDIKYTVGKWITEYINAKDFTSIVRLIAISRCTEQLLEKHLQWSHSNCNHINSLDHISYTEFTDAWVHKFQHSKYLSDSSLVKVIDSFDSLIPQIYNCIKDASNRNIQWV